MHRSLLAGRDCDSPFSDVIAHSEVPHALAHRQTEVDIGKVLPRVPTYSLTHSLTYLYIYLYPLTYVLIY